MRCKHACVLRGNRLTHVQPFIDVLSRSFCLTCVWCVCWSSRLQARELEELAQIYVGRGLPYNLALQVATVLTEKDVIRAHARDELGIGECVGAGAGFQSWARPGLGLN